MNNIFNNSMIETWKEISGYENLYEISNLGNVRNVRTGKIYPSTREASRQTGIHQQSICQCCLGKKNHSVAGKFHWRYVD